MIQGSVNSSIEAIVVLTVMGSNGVKESFESVMDTGFSGHLTLPQEAIRRLCLPWVFID